MALARKPFVVIDAEILSSSIWSESAHTKLVWLTMLILCDTDGYVGAAVPGIARAAGVTLTECQESLRVLSEPDPHSRTTANEGRRVVVSERGFTILNFKAQLDRLSNDRKKSRERVRRHRAQRAKCNVSSPLHGAPVTPGNVTVTPGRRDQGPGTRDNVTESVNLARAEPTTANVPQTNPLIGDRALWVSRWHSGVRALSELTDRDPTEVADAASRYPGAKTGKLNPDTMSEERLMQTVLSLERGLVEERKKRAGPTKRESPLQRAEREAQEERKASA